jgi:tetratricopeptide (TPR) repeat protein
MLLANSAWLLASAGHNVLMVDWDLEAPGLHRYFAPFLTDPELTASNGLIDLVLAYSSEALEPLSASNPRPNEWYRERADVLDYAVSINWKFTNEGTLSLMPSGRQGTSYSVRVNSFNWQNFYERLGGHSFFEALRAAMRRDFDFVLIDSRTGVSDTAGICTVQFPDSLVVCFTLNNQSIEGATAVVRSVLQQKNQESFKVFPIPTRIDNNESDKLLERWKLAKERFGDLVPSNRRSTYWDDLSVLYVPKYAYEEVLAVFANRPDDPANLNLLAHSRRLVGAVFDVTLTPENVSDEVRGNVLDHFSGRSVGTSPAQAQRLAEEIRKKAEADKATAIDQVRSEEKQEAAITLEAMVRKKRKQWALTSAILLALVIAAILANRFYGQRQASMAQQAIVAGDDAAVQKDWLKAVGSYSAAIDHSPQDASVYAKRAAVLAQLSRWDEALTDWNRAVALLPHDSKLILGRAQARILTGQSDGAIQDLNAVLDREPANLDALALLALAQEDAGQIKNAIATYSKLIEKSLGRPEILIQRATLYLQVGDRELAIKDFERVSEESPNSTSAAFAQAQIKVLGVRPTTSSEEKTRAETRRAEEARRAAEETRRAAAEQARKAAAEARVRPEQGSRVAEEEARIRAEQARRAAEEATVRAEQARKAAEEVRIRAEQSRRLESDVGGRVAGQVHIQFTDAADEPIAELLRSALQNEGLRVPKIQLAKEPKAGEIRYYQAEDLENAARAKRIVELELAKRRYLVPLELKLIEAKQGNAIGGLIEVWLPQLSSETVKDLRRRLLR